MDSQTETGLSHMMKALDPSLDRVVSDKVPGPLVLQQGISTKMENSEASKVFIKRGKMSLCIDSLSDSRRESLSDALVAV